jgi:hypothetical protein
MMPADWEQYLAKLERDIKKAPVPTKRQQPKVTRHRSGRQRIAEGQSRNFVRSSYTEDANPTPVRKSTEGLTRNIPLPNWSTGKATGPRQEPKEKKR